MTTLAPGTTVLSAPPDSYATAAARLTAAVNVEKGVLTASSDASQRRAAYGRLADDYFRFDQAIGALILPGAPATDRKELLKADRILILYLRTASLSKTDDELKTAEGEVASAAVNHDVWTKALRQDLHIAA